MELMSLLVALLLTGDQAMRGLTVSGLMQEARLARALKRDRGRQKRILASGIEYEYRPLQAALPQKPKRIRIMDNDDAE